jgi:hypothetical protein
VSKVEVIKFELFGEMNAEVVISIVEVCSHDESVEVKVSVEPGIIFAVVVSVSMMTLVLV